MAPKLWFELRFRILFPIRRRMIRLHGSTSSIWTSTTWSTRCNSSSSIWSSTTWNARCFTSSAPRAWLIIKFVMRSKKTWTIGSLLDEITKVCGLVYSKTAKQSKKGNTIKCSKQGFAQIAQASLLTAQGCTFLKQKQRIRWMSGSCWRFFGKIRGYLWQEYPDFFGFESIYWIRYIINYQKKFAQTRENGTP